MAQQSFGAFGPFKVWDLSGVSKREIETARRRGADRFKVHFSFAVPSGGENATTTTEVKEKDNMAFPCLHM